MDSSAIAQIVAAKVVADTNYWSALVAFAGVVVGAVVSVLGNLALHAVQNHRVSKINQQRKVILERMLRDDRFPGHWRRLDTLSNVIGADVETTKELLIEVSARGSEKDDGLWGLLEYHPLELSEQ